MKARKQSGLQVAIDVLRLAAGAYLVWLDTRPPKPSPSVLPADGGTEPPLLALPEDGAASTAAEPAPASKSKPATAGPYWKRLWGVALASAREWSAHRAASKGAALALYTLFSLAPMLVLVVTVAGLVFGEDTVREALVQQMSNLMGTQGADAIKTLLGGDQEAKSSGVIASAVSGVLVLISATTAFGELKNSLDELWEVPASTESGLWNLIHERFLSFGMILVLALMMLASLAVSAGIAAVSDMWGGDDSPFRWLLQALSNLFAFAVVTGLFAAIFKYLPAVKIAWKDVAVGAVLTAVLFIVGKFLIGLYVANVDISSSYGAAGSVVILITWIFYSAQIFFYGALFTHEYAVQLGSRAGKDESVADNKKPASAGAERVSLLPKAV